LHCRRRPLQVCQSFGHPVIDDEGRYVCAEFQNCRIVSFYMPSGSSGDVRLRVKMRVMSALYQRMKEWAAQAEKGEKQTLLCGDINIAHTCKDLHNWRSNQKNSGFLPEEREWLDAVVNKLGMIDVFRKLNDSGGEYTWWSNRGRAREKNVGWRLDYQLSTPLLAARARQTFVYRDAMFSDHAPVFVRYHFALR
ncbi:MAG: exodeoxyribonuclease III, partial [Gammaproteobacteria bacterium]